MKKLLLLALLALWPAHAGAQSVVACNSSLSQTAVLSSFADNVPGGVTPRNLRDSVCSTVSGTALIGPAFPGLSTTFNAGGQNFSGLIKTLSAAGTSVAGTANEWTWGIQSNIIPSSSLANYEKAALYVNSATSDPSTGLIFRDAVGLIANGTSLVSNGRIFGANVTVSNILGAPSLLTGMEIDVAENNMAQPVGATTNSSAGLSIVPVGSFNVTTGLIVQGLGGGPKFQDAIVVDTGAVAGTALSIGKAYGSGSTSLFTITTSGQVLYYNAPLVGLTAVRQGQIAANTTFGLIAFGKGGTCDFSIYNGAQTQVACVPTNTTTLGINTSSGLGMFNVASANTGGTPSGPTTWTSAFTIVGPNVGTSNGAALAFGYSLNENAGMILALQPSVAWENMWFQANQYRFMVSGASSGTPSVLIGAGLAVGSTTDPGSGKISVNGSSGVSCSGTPTSSFASVGGIVTHC